ncbi:hypothetical protein JCM16303_000279 [Sporobolomyces ruberrimus]
MRRVATTSRSALPRPSAAALARAALRPSSTGSSSARVLVRSGQHARSLATIASPHTPNKSGAASSPASSARKPLFSKILIANRGEIAVRIIRTCRKLGVKTVAVFSEADRNAMHVKMADEAYLLGPAPSHLSYLNIPRLLEVCHQSGAQAVHPGYGFMSENAEFARQLEKEGIVFIGPSVEAIISMGSKAESKDIMKAADVPCIPGWHPSTTGKNPSDPTVDTQSPEFLVLEADKIGYPVLIKAVSGGGGKGMKIVENREEFASQLESAKREGRKSFGDDTVLLEKYVTKPRHVEVQIFSDSHGNHLSLFERDCSVQRRHQKVIEEAPAPNLSQEVRDKLYETARKAARAVGYRGAGTVEFVLNADKPDEFFFLEVNTRLQVEHPVTEAITGVDLVEWQLEVAAGNPIPLKQEEITCTGHAFEVRVYAENPRNNFLPDTGTLLHVKTPKESDYVRLETGFEAGDEISVFYDPLIAKLIVHGPNRREALKRLRKALGEYQIVGPATNLEFLTKLAENEAFADEDLDTGFIPRHYETLFPPLPTPSASTLASSALFLANREISQFPALNASSPWTAPHLAGFRLGEGEGNRYKRTYETGEGKLSVSPAAHGSTGLDVSFFPAAGGDTTTLRDVRPTVSSSNGTSTTVSTLLSSELSRVDIVSSTPSISQALESGVAENLHVFNEAESFAGTIEVKQPSWMKEVASKRGGLSGSKGGGARAPMPSKIVEVKVKAGDRVEAGQLLVVVEAMKMEHVLKAPKAGVVEKVTAQEGDLVKEGQLLVIFEAEAEDGDAICPSPIPRLAQHLHPSTRLYSTSQRETPFLQLSADEDPEDLFYPWTGLSAFKAAHTQARQEQDPTLRDLDLSTIDLLPIRTRGGFLPIYYRTPADRKEYARFFLKHKQVLKLQNSMRNQGNIPEDEIEKAWNAAGRPLVRASEGSDKFKEEKLRGKEQIQDFVARERRKEKKRAESDAKPVSSPRPYEGPLPNSISNHFAKRADSGIPGGSYDSSALEDSDPVYLAWPNVLAIFSEAGWWNDSKQPVGGVAVIPIKTRPGVEAYAANGFSELREVLERFNHRLPKQSSEPAGRSQASTAERTFVSWADIRNAQVRHSKLQAQSSNDALARRRTPLRLLEHLVDISNGGTALLVEANAAPLTERASAAAASASTAASRDLYLPSVEVNHILTRQGVIASTSDSKATKARLGTALPSHRLEQLGNAHSVEIRAVSDFENRLKTLRDPTQFKDSMPWLEVDLSKGTKRNANAVTSTKGQLLTPNPSVESTPEPIPPPLKRAKSSEAVPTSSNLSLSKSTLSSRATSTDPPASVPRAVVPATTTEVDTTAAAESLADAKAAASKSFELETLRHAYETAQREGGASFLSLDVEFWERDHEVLTEFGWSLVDFVRHQNGKVTERREDQHAVIKENQRFRNGRFAPDARDHFDFGRTLVLPSRALYYLLHALFSTLSTTHPLFLVFHDPRGDIRALSKLGFDSEKVFLRDLRNLGKKRDGGGIWVVDTQRVFSAWFGRKDQIGLEKACKEVEVPTKRLHNAGNDAHYTLTLLERLMDRSLLPAANSPLLALLEERSAAAKQAKLLAAAARNDEQVEQAGLIRK